jgi:hypothetical protein
VLAGDRGELPVVKRHFMMFVVSTIAVCGLIVLMLPPTWLTSRGHARVAPSLYGDGSDGECVFDGMRDVPGTTHTVVVDGTVYFLERDLFCTLVQVNDDVLVVTRGHDGVLHRLLASRSMRLGQRTTEALP